MGLELYMYRASRTGMSSIWKGTMEDRLLPVRGIWFRKLKGSDASVSGNSGPRIAIKVPAQ